MQVASFTNILNQIPINITGAEGEDEMVFTFASGDTFRLYHNQDCCEHVSIADICGSLLDLIGAPILLAERVSEHPASTDNDESQTWTFYRFTTMRGHVSIRWVGTSNGYYSEGVDEDFTYANPPTPQPQTTVTVTNADIDTAIRQLREENHGLEPYAPNVYPRARRIADDRRRRD